MIRKYKDLKEINLELHQKFKDEYDRRINNYIKTGKFILFLGMIDHYFMIDLKNNLRWLLN